MLVSGSVSLFSPDSAHVINVHLPVFDAMSLSWTFSGFHCQVWMHLSCNLFEWLKTMLWRWGFPRVFFSPPKKGWFQNPWHFDSMTIDRLQGPAGRLWKVNYLECDMEVTGGSKGARGWPSFGEDETEGWACFTVAEGVWHFFQEVSELMDMNSHLIFAIWQIWPWSFYSLPFKDDYVIFIEYGYVWVLFK